MHDTWDSYKIAVLLFLRTTEMQNKFSMKVIVLKTKPIKPQMFPYYSAN